MTNKFKSRITEYGFINPKDIVLNPYNTKIHPDLQHNAIKALLSDIGWVQSIIINKRTGNLVDGHDRVKNAIESGEESIPVTYIDITITEEKQLLLLLDEVTTYAIEHSQNIANISDAFDLITDENLRFIIDDIFDRNKINVPSIVAEEESIIKDVVESVEKPTNSESDTKNIDPPEIELTSICYYCVSKGMCSIRSTLLPMAEKQQVAINIIKCHRYERKI
jgi:hypothetical protein